MVNSFLTNGLLGMGGLGGGQSGMNSLLGDLYDPREMRKQQMKQMLLGMGVGLMSEKGMGRGAELALVAGNRAADDYRQSALDAYRLKMGEEDRAYQRERDQRADAWQNTQMQWKMDDRQAQEDQDAAADDAWNNLRTMPTTGIPVQNYGMADQLWQMGKKDEAINLITKGRIGAADASVKSYAPIPYDMGNGQIGYGIPMEDGSFRPVDVPEGSAFIPPYDKAYQTSAGTARGRIDAENTASAPADVSAADDALMILDQIVTSPYLERGTGFSSYGNMVYGTGGYDFQNLVNQAKSGAFLTAIQQMKGLGALSNMEGQAATAAITRMDTATSKEAFLKAVADYRAIIEKGRARAAARMPSAPPPPAAPQVQGDDGWTTLSNGIRVREKAQ